MGSILELNKSLMEKHKTLENTREMFPVGTLATVIVVARDFHFFNGNEKVKVVKNEPGHMIIVEFEDGRTFNFNPEDLKIRKEKKERPNSYNNFFSEPFHYGDGYGYAVAAKDSWEAREKIVEYLAFDDLGNDFIERLKRELRENMRQCWVRYQGYQDDDGVFGNGWVITSEWMGGKKGWKQVWESDYNRHYVTHGHRYEPKADERGNRVNYSYNDWNCAVCNQIEKLSQDLKDIKAVIKGAISE